MFGDKPQEWPQKFAFIMVPEFTMMPTTAAIEPLRLANRCAEKPLYKWAMHSVDGKPVAASNGILAMVDGDLDQINEHDTVIIMHNDAVVQGLSERPFMDDVERWAVLTIGTGLGNARFTNRRSDQS